MNESDSNPKLKRLLMMLGEPGDLSDWYLTDTPHGGLIVPSTARFEDEEVVELHLMFGNSKDKYVIQGAVLWCREDNRAGYIVAVGFFASEMNTREKLISKGLRPVVPA